MSVARKMTADLELAQLKERLASMIRNEVFLAKRSHRDFLRTRMAYGPRDAWTQMDKARRDGQLSSARALKEALTGSRSLSSIRRIQRLLAEHEPGGSR